MEHQGTRGTQYQGHRSITHGLSKEESIRVSEAYNTRVTNVWHISYQRYRIQVHARYIIPGSHVSEVQYTRVSEAHNTRFTGIQNIGSSRYRTPGYQRHIIPVSQGY